MSVFGGRRTSSPAPGRARPADDAQAQSPHFRAAPPSTTDLDTVEEARTVLESLRIHLDELERREQSLNGQLALLEREQRNLRLQTQQFAAEQLEQQQALRDRQQTLDEREQDLAGREAAAATLVDHAQEQQQAVDSQQAELDRQRADYREELWSEIAAAHEQLQQDRLALEQSRSELDNDRKQQREALAAELGAERRQFQEQQAELEQARTELNDAQAEWQSQRELEIAEHTALLDQLRAERLEEVQAREADVSRREVDLVKRTRFQEEHLARLRAGIEARQTELERRRASLNVWIEQIESTARGRLAHLRKYRDVLEQRELACDAAWQALADARDRQQAIVGELRQQIADEQSAFAEEQRALAGDFRRHAELLQLREQDVERRTARIEQLRDELQRQQQLLSARETAIRDAADWLAERIGSDATDLLVPRDDLPAVPAPDVAAQRAEIAGAQRQLAQWHQQLQNERESFSQMIADREQRLQGREDALRRQLEQLAERENELQQAQARDRLEREQTFAVLESLVEQIERRLRG